MLVGPRALARRTVLRGAGVCLALPWLDAMTPAARPRRLNAASDVRRLVAVYIGNGMNMAAWTPTASGPLALSPTLASLAPFRDDLVVLSGLDNREGGSSEQGGLHSRIQPAWLTGAHARRTEGHDVSVGVSMDQFAADVLGADTPLRSLELALESVALTQACEPGFACTYVSTLAWRDATTPRPADVDPRAVFERLFGDGRSRAAQDADRRRDRSILDRVTADLGRLQAQLGPSDRAVVDGYVDAIRDVERHIAATERRAAENPLAPPSSVPVADISGFTGIPTSAREHAGLMADLLTLAFRADTTRVATLLLVRERSERSFPESGVTDPAHALSHHERDPEKLARQARLNAYHLGLVGDLLAKLRAASDTESSLLDRTVVLVGSGMSDSNTHSPLGVPTLVAGGRGLGVVGGRHLVCAPQTPLANLHRSLLDRVGVAVEHVGDSTGRIAELAHA